MKAPSRAYAWYVLILLTMLNVVNYMDRMVISSMHDNLRSLFGFNETQIGSFWFAFFAVHGILLIPFGWASDRYHRVRIAAFGVLFWSFATLGSAWAVGFWSLFLLRAMIGVGEAAYGPVANTLLCEVFPETEKAKTVGIYNAGMFIGSCLGMALGGVLGFPLAFEIVALPGLILGILVWTLKVPSHRADLTPEQKTISLRGVLKASVRALNRNSLRWLLMAGILISFTAGAMIERVVDFVTAYKGMSKESSTLLLGGLTLTAGVMGVIVGGFVADRLQRKFAHGRILAVAIGFGLAVPFALGTVLIDGGILFYASMWLLIFFLPWYNGPMAAVIDDVVRNDEANNAQASFACVLHIIGTGPASVIVGFVADSLVEWGLVAQGQGLRYALLLPVFSTIGAVFCCLMACRHVAADMEAKKRDDQALVARSLA